MILTAWDWRKGRIAANLMGHRNTIRTIAVSQNGRFAATGSNDCTIRIHDLGLLHDDRLPIGEEGDFSSVVASDDAGVIAALESASNHLVVVDGRHGRITKRYTDPSPHSPAFTLSGDGQRLAMACKDGSIRIVRLRTGRFLPPVDGLGGLVTALAGVCTVGGVMPTVTCVSDEFALVPPRSLAATCVICCWQHPRVPRW